MRRSSVRSNISGFSSIIRSRKSKFSHGGGPSTSPTHDTLLHWYRSHTSGLHSANQTIHTEESDNECVCDEARYQFKLTSFLCNPHAKCYYRLKKIRAYRHYIQNKYEETFRTLRWIDLPGGQHRVAVERNYLINYVWLMSFIINEVDTTNKDTARHIRFRFEELLVQAEKLGIVLQRFFVPLQVLAQNHALVEEMGELLQYRKINRPKVEKKILRLNVKPDNTMLSGNKVTDFSKLLIYVRKDCQVWTRFRTLAESDKVDIVTKGLMEVADNLKDLRGLIKSPLKAIKAGGSKFELRRPVFVRHVQQMRNELKTIITSYKSKTEVEDRVILESFLSELLSHYSYVLKYGELMVEEIWDIILMARLSYDFIRENSQNNIATATHEAIMVSKFRASKVKKLLKQSHFTPEDFYKTDCPDTLRKLPVVVFPANAELSLHLQGHRNAHRFQASTPAHKFSLKKRQSSRSAQIESTHSVPVERNKLMFVSEGDN